MISQTAMYDPEVIKEEKARNNNVFWVTRYGFYGQVVGEILKTISGDATVGAFTLGMCAIAAFAELEHWNKHPEHFDDDGNITVRPPKNEKLFQVWVNEWLNHRQHNGALNKPYDSRAVYAIRCALAHTYGWAHKLEEAEIDGYELRRGQPDIHCLPKRRVDGKLIYQLNLEDFIADLIFAFDDCCQHLIPNKDSSFLKYVNKLIIPRRLDASEQLVVVDTRRVSLDFFDSRLEQSPLKVEKAEIIEKMRGLKNT